MTDRRRLGAWMLCIGIVLVLFVSSAFIMHEAGHDCTGEDCPICRMVAVNVNLLRAFGLAVLVLPAPAVILRDGSAYRVQHRLCLSASDTLVSWKIRLND